MGRIKLTVAYDGTNYHGWQLQPGEATIEGELNKALSQLTGKQVCVTGASRTDAGVHALGNVAVFDTSSHIPAEKFSYALNQRLPADIVVQCSEEVPGDFHPRHCECRKTYEYTILNRKFPLPQYRNTAYFYYGKLDINRMRSACSAFIGEHDFAGFCSSGAQVQSTIRTIYSLEVLEENIPEPDANTARNHEYGNNIARTGRIITIRVEGNGFLYNMVRIIAGTLLETGKGRINPDDMKEIIASCDRNRAGATAPARGLKLVQILY
ncbi:MAG: tRNA pseudouridine(38-40) synthase TruA [Lachnospiraceae bacterium]|nr:tRNA pseudouridine(38-40) synthase TruA [Lachnospiraceae bacterium]